MTGHIPIWSITCCSTVNILLFWYISWDIVQCFTTLLWIHWSMYTDCIVNISMYCSALHHSTSLWIICRLPCSTLHSLVEHRILSITVLFTSCSVNLNQQSDASNKHITHHYIVNYKLHSNRLDFDRLCSDIFWWICHVVFGYMWMNAQRSKYINHIYRYRYRFRFRFWWGYRQGYSTMYQLTPLS